MKRCTLTLGTTFTAGLVTAGLVTAGVLTLALSGPSSAADDLLKRDEETADVVLVDNEDDDHTGDRDLTPVTRGGLAGDGRWCFRDGDRVTDELTLVRLVSGGSDYEAYLAFDEITYGPVVVGGLRPDQVADPHGLRGLRRAVDTLALVNHPAVVRGRPTSSRGSARTSCSSTSTGRVSSLLRRYGPCRSRSTCRWRWRWPRPCTSSATSTWCTSI